MNDKLTEHFKEIDELLSFGVESDDLLSAYALEKSIALDVAAQKSSVEIESFSKKIEDNISVLKTVADSLNKLRGKSNSELNQCTMVGIRFQTQNNNYSIEGAYFKHIFIYWFSFF